MNRIKLWFEELRDNPYAPIGALLIVAGLIYFVLLTKGCR